MFASLALASCQLILVTDKPSCSLDETSNFFLLILGISKDAKLQVHPDEVQTSPRLYQISGRFPLKWWSEYSFYVVR